MAKINLKLNLIIFYCQKGREGENLLKKEVGNKRWVRWGWWDDYCCLSILILEVLETPRNRVNMKFEDERSEVHVPALSLPNICFGAKMAQSLSYILSKLPHPHSTGL